MIKIGLPLFAKLFAFSFHAVAFHSSGAFAQSREKSPYKAMTAENWESVKSIYEFHASDIDGNDQSMEKYRGKVLIIVNGAPYDSDFRNYAVEHYKQLGDMFKKYERDGLAIAVFPSSGFSSLVSAEALPGDQLKELLEGRFGVTFDIYASIDANGENAHPLYKWLKAKQNWTLDWQKECGFTQDTLKWFFTKFLLNRDGQPVGRWDPNTPAEAIEPDVVLLLGVAKKEEL